MRLCTPLVVLLLLTYSVNTSFADEKVKVGVLLPLTGLLASFGKTILQAVREVQSDGVELIVEDDECLPAKSVSAFKKLSEVDRVSFLLGPVCGSPQHSVVPLLEKKGVVSMLVGSGSSQLFQLSGKRVFSPQYSNEDEAKFNAAFMERLGVKRVALVFYDDIFCWSHEKSFRKHFKGAVAETLTFSSFDPAALKPIVARIRNLKVDGIYAPDVSPFILGFKKELGKVGLSTLPIVSIFSAQTPDLLEAEGASAEGIMYSYPSISDQDSVGYFSKLGASLFFEYIRNCQGNAVCVREKLLSDKRFDDQGVFSGSIEMKVIKGGRFATLAPNY